MKSLVNASIGIARHLFLALVVAGSASCGAGGTGAPGGVAESYDAAVVTAMRAEKDAAFREADSPIPDTARSSFTGLQYYPIVPELAFSVPLEVFGEKRQVKIAATGGDVRMMTRYGRFRFEVDGKRCSLIVYKSDAASSHLFVPFMDETNGAETYEVGRYIDLEEHDESEPYLLDFNRSYNPYCAYNESFTCPIVPEENALSVAIRAGEKRPAGVEH